MRLTDVDQLFTPENVAVFGASDREDSVGGMVYRNLLAGGCKGSCFADQPEMGRGGGQPLLQDLAELERTWTWR
jgi:acetyltransferase